MSVDESEPMIRWQAYARESRTAANSHFLAYAAAILAIQASVLMDKDVAQVDWAKTFLGSGVAATLSLVLGSIVVLVRLRDARLTARLARYKHVKRSQREIEALRKSVLLYGAWTNKLLPCQVLAFALAAILFVVWVVSEHIEKLIRVAG
jgi:hypothetical protein